MIELTISYQDYPELFDPMAVSSDYWNGTGLNQNVIDWFRINDIYACRKFLQFYPLIQYTFCFESEREMVLFKLWWL